MMRPVRLRKIGGLVVAFALDDPDPSQRLRNDSPAIERLIRDILSDKTEFWRLPPHRDVIEASAKDPNAWNIMERWAHAATEFEELRDPSLTQWALEVAAGIRTRPKSRRGRPDNNSRNVTICHAIRILNENYGFTIGDAQRAVAEQSNLSEDAIRTIWRNKSANCSP